MPARQMVRDQLEMRAPSAARRTISCSIPAITLDGGSEALLRSLVRAGCCPARGRCRSAAAVRARRRRAQLVVVEPGQVVDGAAAADDDDRVGSVFAAELLQRLEQGQADLGCGTSPWKRL